LEKDDELIAHLNSNSLFRRQLLDEYNVLLKLMEKESPVLSNIREVYGLLDRTTFNFFEPIDKYWFEDFHEIILTQILNPRTKEIGNIRYLHVFEKLLHDINENYNQDNIFDNNVIVENQIGDEEHGYIDILISDDDKAIIIESKINGAKDQDNQLARYYRYVTKVLNKKIMAIVYLRPVDDENKMPPFNDYTKEYEEDVNNINKLKLLIPVSIVNRSNKIDLCHGFLDICRNIDNIDKARIYIKQYSELLKILGGKKMIMNIEKEIFKKLFGDTGSVVKTTDIGEIWDNRRKILASLIQDKLIKEKEFRPDGDEYAYKDVNDKIKLTFIYDPSYKKIGNDYVFGFSFFEKITNQIKQDLEKILGDMGFENFLSKEIECIEDWLVIKRLYITINKPVDEIIKNVLDMYTLLESKAMKKLK
jgi:hypothetical protein